jgi:hypothetical protein
MNLSEKHPYKKVIVSQIVFLQGDDFSQYEEESPESDLNYLLQWYNGDNDATGEFYSRDINTPFLGKLIKIRGYKGYWLFSKNSSIGYIGLARIVRFY